MLRGCVLQKAILPKTDPPARTPTLARPPPPPELTTAAHSTHPTANHFYLIMGTQCLTGHL